MSAGSDGDRAAAMADHLIVGRLNAFDATWGHGRDGPEEARLDEAQARAVYAARLEAPIASTDYAVVHRLLKQGHPPTDEEFGRLLEGVPSDPEALRDHFRQLRSLIAMSPLPAERLHQAYEYARRPPGYDPSARASGAGHWDPRVDAWDLVVLIRDLITHEGADDALLARFADDVVAASERPLPRAIRRAVWAAPPGQTPFAEDAFVRTVLASERGGWNARVLWPVIEFAPAPHPGEAFRRLADRGDAGELLTTIAEDASYDRPALWRSLTRADLKPALADDDSEVRQAALWALGRLRRAAGLRSPARSGPEEAPAGGGRRR